MDSSNLENNSETPIVGEVTISSNRSFSSRIRTFFSKCNLITVEPIIFLMALATGMIGVSIKSLYLQRICEFEFRNESSILEHCSNLTDFPDQEQQVQKMAGTYSTYQNFVQAGPPILLAFIWGGLNDRLGAKKLLIIPLIGYLIESIIYYFLTFSTGSSPALLLFASIPNGVTGGTVTLTISIFKLIVHYSDAEERTFRIGFAEAAMLIGAPIGLFSGAALVAQYGFSSVFLISAFLEVGAIIYAILFLKNDAPSTSSETRILSLSAIKDGVLVCFQQRPSRPVIITLIIILGIRSFVITGKGATEYLYTILKFHWDQGTYAAFTTFDGTIAALGVLGISTIFAKILHVKDSILGIICAITFTISCLVYGFASVGWMMYLGSTIQMAAGMGIIIVRSMITQFVGSGDVGKALSFIAIPEQILPFLANPFYNFVYVSTVGFFPGTVYLISAGLNLIVTCLFFFIFWKTRGHQMEHYESLDE